MLNLLKRLMGRERRRYPRTRGVRITINGEDAEVLDWSPGGFRIARLEKSAPERGSYIQGEVRVDRTSGAFTAFVVAVHPDGCIGARYDEIDSRVFQKLI